MKLRNHSHVPGARDRRRGFSLPELLVAVVIGAALITAAVTFAFSMGELWGSGSETRLFDQHVRGVSRFLESMLQEATPPPAESESSLEAPSSETEEASIVWQKPRGKAGGARTEELLTFELVESPGIFAWPGQPLPFVVCALRLDRDDGLFLQWKSRLEIDFADVAPREMRVSPFVTGITYYYYDAEGNQEPTWEESDTPKMGENRELETPRRLRLTFEYESLTREVNLILPGISTGAPVY
ncbi:MAG: PilW family protein [Opitutaceae bacterium]